MLDGFPGKMARLRETYDILNATWPAGWSPDRLIDAMQTGDRISYHPERAFAEVSGLPAKLAGLADLLGAMRATESSPKVDDYNRLVDTALAHIADIKVTQPPQ